MSEDNDGVWHVFLNHLQILLILFFLVRNSTLIQTPTSQSSINCTKSENEDPDAEYIL